MLDFLGKSAYNKDNESGNQASHLTRQEENPLTELQSPKGGLLFSAYGPRTIRQATYRCNKKLHLLRQTAQKLLNFAFIPPPSHLKMGGRGRKVIITYFSTKRYRKSF